LSCNFVAVSLPGLAQKIVPEMTCNVWSGTLNNTAPYHTIVASVTS